MFCILLVVVVVQNCRSGPYDLIQIVGLVPMKFGGGGFYVLYFVGGGWSPPPFFIRTGP